MSGAGWARLRVATAACLLLGWPRESAAQAATPAPSISSRRELTLKVAREIITRARYATLATVGETGAPQARVVDPLSPDSGFVVYVATNPKSRKVAEIRRNPRVSLLYFDSGKLAYVTVVGEASEVPSAEKTKYRKSEWDAFFPKDKPDDYRLYRVRPVRLEVVSASDGLPGDPATWRPEIVEMK